MILIPSFKFHIQNTDINQMTTQEVIANFTTLFEGKEEEVSLSEMKKMLTEVHKATTSGKAKKEKKAKKDVGEEKPKRAATPYNLFMQKKMAEFKEEGSSLTGKEKMTEIAKLWKEMKGFVSSDEEEPKVVEEVKVVEEEVKVVEEEVKVVEEEVKKGKKKGGSKK